MLPKVIIGAVILGIGLVFVFKDKLPANSSSTGSSEKNSAQKQQVKSMTFDEVLALGGTCFTKPFIDETKDVEGSKEGEARVKAPDKDEYDIQRIAIAKDGDSLMSMWEFVGQIDASWLNNHNISVQTYYELPLSHGYRVEVRKEAHGADWYGQAVHSKDGKTEDFDPMVRIHGRSIQFLIPLKFVSDKGVVDGLMFAGLFYEKPTSTMYTDDLPVPREKRNPKAGLTSWFCAFQ